MSHYHLFSSKYFFPHFDRFLLVLKVDILFVWTKFLISWSWLSFKSLLFRLISGTIFFNEIHVFGSSKYFGKIDVNFVCISEMNDVTGAAWLGDLLKLGFETQLLFTCIMFDWLTVIFSVKDLSLENFHYYFKLIRKTSRSKVVMNSFFLFIFSFVCYCVKSHYNFLCSSFN